MRRILYRTFSTASAACASSSLAPPFTLTTATAKVVGAESLWNTRNPELISKAYTNDSIWRNRSEFLQGRKAIQEFLTRKWKKELDYVLRKELFAFQDNRIAVQFWYEYRDEHDQWYRAHGLEHWTFDNDGLMKERRSSINDVPIDVSERWFACGTK